MILYTLLGAVLILRPFDDSKSNVKCWLWTFFFSASLQMSLKIELKCCVTGALSSVSWLPPDCSRRAGADVSTWQLWPRVHVPRVSNVRHSDKPWLATPGSVHQRGRPQPPSWPRTAFIYTFSGKDWCSENSFPISWNRSIIKDWQWAQSYKEVLYRVMLLPTHDHNLSCEYLLSSVFLTFVISGVQWGAWLWPGAFTPSPSSSCVSWPRRSRSCWWRRLGRWRGKWCWPH